MQVWRTHPLAGCGVATLRCFPTALLEAEAVLTIS
jgi:hypothetical protein